MSAIRLLVFCITLMLLVSESLENSTETTTELKPVRPSNAKTLYDTLFESYRVEVRPIYDDSQPVNVTLRFWMKQIQKVDETDQILRVYCWLEEYWTDEFLVWDPKQINGIDTIHVPTNNLWKPDILVYNSASMNIKESELETNVLVRHNGSVLLFRSMITDITCNLDLTYFPFDQQVCYIMMASWSFDGSKVVLELADKKDYMAYYIPNNEWTITDFTAKRNFKYYDCCPYPFVDIRYYFILERSPSYYIFSLVIPSGFITVVTIIGFFTPYSTTGENTEKVSLGVTALLSMAIIMMMISDEMPATNQVMPLIGKYYIGLIFIIFGAAFTTTVTLALQMRGNCGRPVPQWARHFFFILLPRFYVFSWLLPLSDELISQEELLKEYQLQQQTYMFDSPNNNRADGVCGEGEGRNGSLLGLGRGSPPPLELRSTANRLLYRGFSVGAKGNRRPMPGTTGHQTACAQERSIGRILETITRIDERLKRRHLDELVIREWQCLARVLERILMLAFVFLIGFFIAIVFSNQGPRLTLTEEVMNKVN